MDPFVESINKPISARGREGPLCSRGCHGWRRWLNERDKNKGRWKIFRVHILILPQELCTPLSDVCSRNFYIFVTNSNR